jgi:hypothetical protein
MGQPAQPYERRAITLTIIFDASGKAILTCPFMSHFLAKHPEYADVIAR